MNAANTEPRPATRLEIGTERRKAAAYDDATLISQFNLEWRDALQVVGPWSSEREAVVAGLSLEMERRRFK
jgi:hypothetical protein